MGVRGVGLVDSGVGWIWCTEEGPGRHVEAGCHLYIRTLIVICRL